MPCFFGLDSRLHVVLDSHEEKVIAAFPVSLILNEHAESIWRDLRSGAEESARCWLWVTTANVYIEPFHRLSPVAQISFDAIQNLSSAPLALSERFLCFTNGAINDTTCFSVSVSCSEFVVFNITQQQEWSQDIRTMSIEFTMRPEGCKTCDDVIHLLQLHRNMSKAEIDQEEFDKQLSIWSQRRLLAILSPLIARSCVFQSCRAHYVHALCRLDCFVIVSEGELTIIADCPTPFLDQFSVRLDSVSAMRKFTRHDGRACIEILHRPYVPILLEISLEAEGSCSVLDQFDDCTNEVPGYLTDEWLHGKISTFDYLTELNWRAGRSLTCPQYLPLFPWVDPETGTVLQSDSTLAVDECQQEHMFCAWLGRSNPFLKEVAFSRSSIPVVTTVSQLRGCCLSCPPMVYSAQLEPLCVLSGSDSAAATEFFDVPDHAALLKWSRHLRSVLDSQTVGQEIPEYIDKFFGYLVPDEYVCSIQGSLTNDSAAPRLFDKPHPRRPEKPHIEFADSSAQTVTEQLDAALVLKKLRQECHPRVFEDFESEVRYHLCTLKSMEFIVDGKLSQLEEAGLSAHHDPKKDDMFRHARDLLLEGMPSVLFSLSSDEVSRLSSLERRIGDLEFESMKLGGQPNTIARNERLSDLHSKLDLLLQERERIMFGKFSKLNGEGWHGASPWHNAKDHIQGCVHRLFSRCRNETVDRMTQHIQEHLHTLKQQMRDQEAQTFLVTVGEPSQLLLEELQRENLELRTRLQRNSKQSNALNSKLVDLRAEISSASRIITMADASSGMVSSSPKAGTRVIRRGSPSQRVTGSP